MKNTNKFKLTNEAIDYLRKIISEMKLSLPIDEDMLDEIVDYVLLNYEIGLLDDDYALPRKGFEEEHKKAVDFVSEISGQWADSIPDIDDINAKLSLIDNI